MSSPEVGAISYQCLRAPAAMGVGARERNFPAYETRLVIQHIRGKLMQHRLDVDVEHKIMKQRIPID